MRRALPSPPAWHFVLVCCAESATPLPSALPQYMAPEVYRHERYSMKCDVYSFAIVLYEMFEGILMLVCTAPPLPWQWYASSD